MTGTARAFPDAERVDLTAALRAAASHGDAAHLEVIRERQLVLRFGQRRVVYQHAEDRPLVRLRLVRDGRTGWSILGSARVEAIDQAAARLAVACAALPAGDPVAMPGPWSMPETTPAAAPSTLAAGSGELAATFERLLGAVPGTTGIGGSITVVVTTVQVRNSEGLDIAEERSKAILQLIVTRGDRSSFVRRIDPDWNRIDPLEAASSAMDGLPGPATADLPMGRARVLLGPQAVATFAATLAHIGLGATDARTPSGPFADAGIGDTVAAGLVGMKDDARDPAGLPAAFDAGGWAKRSVRLLDAGRLVGLVHDARTAAAWGTSPTGHAAPPGWRFGAGPNPSHLLVDAGDQPRDALAPVVDDGVAVQRVDYVRVVQPRLGIVTGTTRDAATRIVHGRIGPAVPPFRFTVALGDLFRGVEAVSADRERGEAPFMDAITAPAMVVRALPIDAPARR